MSALAAETGYPSVWRKPGPFQPGSHVANESHGAQSPAKLNDSMTFDGFSCTLQGASGGPLAHCAGGPPQVDGTFSLRRPWLRRGWRRAGEVYEKSFEMRRFRVSA